MTILMKFRLETLFSAEILGSANSLSDMKPPNMDLYEISDLDFLLMRIVHFSCHRHNETNHLSRPQPDLGFRRLVFVRLTNPACCRAIDLSDTAPAFLPRPRFCNRNRSANPMAPAAPRVRSRLYDGSVSRAAWLLRCGAVPRAHVHRRDRSQKQNQRGKAGLIPPLSNPAFAPFAGSQKWFSRPGPASKCLHSRFPRSDGTFPRLPAALLPPACAP